jgi:hypothetical protein
MTMRSKGNSKIIGAAIAPMKALPIRISSLSEPPINQMPRKRATMHAAVTGKTGCAGLEWIRCWCISWCT